MTRVILDTNILISALLQQLGPSAQLFLLCLNGSLQLCLTGAIYAEYKEVISRPRFKLNPDVIAATLKAIRDIALWVKPAGRVNICSDPDDNVFLERAETAQASRRSLSTPQIGSSSKSRPICSDSFDAIGVGCAFCLTEGSLQTRDEPMTNQHGHGGILLQTQGIRACPKPSIRPKRESRNRHCFTPDNNPCGERDFCSFEVNG